MKTTTPYKKMTRAEKEAKRAASPRNQPVPQEILDLMEKIHNESAEEMVGIRAMWTAEFARMDAERVGK